MNTYRVLRGITAIATFSFAAAQVGQADVREVQSMQEVRRFLDHRTLLVLDLDNTVMEPIQTIGSDQWFEHLVTRFISQGRDKPSATALAVEIWSQVQMKTKMKAVESMTPGMIAVAQSSGIPVLALTARPMELAFRTEEQLRNIGVSFAQRPVYPRNVVSPNSGNPQYVRGIVYVGANLSKGEALIAFLRTIRLSPRKVVFVDDKSKHVESVNASLGMLPIEHFEFRYGAADPRVRSFDSQLADIQHRYFATRGVLLSDQEARSLMGGRGASQPRDAALAGLVCNGEGLSVRLSDRKDSIGVTMGSRSGVYPVTGVTSRTGDIDFTYLTAAGVSLTLDDQFGDSVTIRSRRLSLKCEGRS